MQKLGKIDLALHDLPHDLLLAFHALIGVDHYKIEFSAHCQVLLQDASLKNAEAFIGIT